MTEKKKYVLIIISVLLLVVLGLFLMRGRGVQRRRWRWLERISPFPTLSYVTPSPKPTLPQATPTPAPSPTLQPSPTPTEKTSSTTISESEFNSYLAQGVDQQPPERENKYTSASIDFQEDIGILKMHFEKGQDLTGEVFVTADGKSLDLRNVSVTGAAGLESLFIQIASGEIKEGLDNLVARIGTSVRLEKLELKTDSLLIYYQLI